MKRKTYRLDELKAGTTIFVGGVDHAHPDLQPFLAEFLVVGGGARWPEPGEMTPYRVSKEMAETMSKHLPLHRTRASAARYAMAERRACQARWRQ
ncbi:hypothetical protein [Halomonas getboli]|uniref:hypothetical protein n=1 Tax=Halomonas getboli TaxID=2935862 RepID=UPI001FFF3849|nr:hypothetical protein [Halomonas getboli]MCK2185726.1 hypothetical protein [Halomonas getboli]